MMIAYRPAQVCRSVICLHFCQLFVYNFLFILARSTKKEIEIVSSVQLSDHHSQYVDLCQWNPKQDIFATASTDKNCYLWNTKDYHNGNPKSVQVSPIENSQQTVSCLAWSPNGKFLILGLFILPVSCLGKVKVFFERQSQTVWLIPREYFIGVPTTSQILMADSQKLSFSTRR